MKNKVICFFSLIAIIIGFFVYIRPTPLADRHLPNEWHDFQKEWATLTSEGSELEYVKNARAIYKDWRNPEKPSAKEMKDLYNRYSGLFPEIYKDQIKKNKEKIGNEYSHLTTHPGGALSIGYLMVDNALLKQNGIYQPEEKKKKIRKEFYAMYDEYNKKVKKREAKMNQPERVVFKRLLDLRKKYTKGESLPPLLNRVREESNLIKMKKEKDIFKYQPWTHYPPRIITS